MFSFFFNTTLTSVYFKMDILYKYYIYYLSLTELIFVYLCVLLLWNKVLINHILLTKKKSFSWV